MSDQPENSQLTSTTAVSELEFRIAALEKRVKELETLNFTQLKSSARRVEEVSEDTKVRLARIEERHENLLRNTPGASEEGANAAQGILAVAAMVLILIIFFSWINTIHL